MKEAIFILEKEKKILEECLKGWKKENHPEAFKERNKKYNELTKAIEILKSNNF